MGQEIEPPARGPAEASPPAGPVTAADGPAGAADEPDAGGRRGARATAGRPAS